MQNYDGAELKINDFNILKKLEKTLGKELIYSKFFEDEYWDFTGFYAEDGNVTHLSIQSEENLVQFPLEILELSNLKMLVLIGLAIKNIPVQIDDLKSLEVLILMFCSELIELPNSIGHLRLLKDLVIIKNKIKNIPESIGELAFLNELDISDNQIEKLPDSISKLQSLKRLKCSNNKLLTLPESIGNLKSLKSLYLDYNKISNIPKSISKLKNLENIVMSNNLVAYNYFITIPFWCSARFWSFTSQRNAFL